MRQFLTLLFLLLMSVSESLAVGNYRSLADSLCTEGVKQYEAGRMREAQVMTSRAIELLEADGDTLYVTRCTAYTNLSRYFVRLGENDKAVRAIDKAMGLRKSLGLKRDINYADLLLSKALILSGENKYEEALSLLDEVLVISRRYRLLGSDGLISAASLRKAGLLLKSGRYDEALEYVTSLESVAKSFNDEEVALSFTLGCMLIAEEIYSAKGENESAAGLVRNNDEFALLISERYPSLYSFYLKERANEAFRKNDNERAKGLLNEALNYNPAVADELECFKLLCLIHFELGEMEEALGYARKLMEAVESRPVLDEGKYASVFLTYLNICQKLGKYAEGIAVGREKEPFFIGMYGPESKNYASLLSNLSTLYASSGEMEKFFETGERSLAIREKISGEDDSDIALSLLNLAVGYSMFNEPRKALNCLQRAENIYLNGNMSDHHLKMLSNIYCTRAMAYGALDEYNKALEMLDMSREYYYRSGMIDYQSYCTILNNYLVIYLETGNDSEGKKIIDELSDLIEKGKLTPQLAIYGSVINSMGQNLSRFFNDERAIRLLDQADKALADINPKHPIRIYVLNNLGLSWSKVGDIQKARKYYFEALSLRDELGIDCLPQMITIQNNIILELCGVDPELGRMFLVKEIESLEASGNATWRSAMLYSQYATFLFFDGELEKALDFARKGVELQEKQSMTDSYLQREVISNYAFLLLQNGDTEKFLEVAGKLSDRYAEDLRTSFPMLTEEERYNYWNNCLGDWYVSILPHALTVFSSDRLNELVFDGLLKSRGVLLASSMALSDLIAESDDKELAELYADLRGAKAKLSHPAADYDDNDIEGLKEDLYRIEQKLNDRSSEVGDFMKEFNISSLDVRKNLWKDEIVIEFVVSQKVDMSYVYGALILNPASKSIRYIPLENPDILFSFDYNREEDLERLGQALFGPLEKELPSHGTLYFTPDGVLHNLPVEAALNSYFEKKGVETVPDIRRLTSSRLLALKQIPHKLQSAAIYGGMDFNASPGKKSRMDKAGGRAVSADVSGGNLFRDVDGVLPVLQGTLDEALAAERILKDNNINVMITTGADGTEGSFKDLSGERYSLIHVGTHGFYWSEEEAAEMSDIGFLKDSFTKGNVTDEDRSLLRSGLLFAGGYPTLCNSASISAEEEDGVLTAREIAGMNLRDCDIVVLSACKTGLGDITSDGVFGLQRGFKKAGVNTILMSLWPVNDKATGIFMEEFYRLLAAGRSAEDALKGAKTHLRSYHPDSQDGVIPYSSFTFWAPFVLIDSY